MLRRYNIPAILSIYFSLCLTNKRLPFATRWQAWWTLEYVYNRELNAMLPPGSYILFDACIRSLLVIMVQLWTGYNLNVLCVSFGNAACRIWVTKCYFHLLMFCKVVQKQLSNLVPVNCVVCMWHYCQTLPKSENSRITAKNVGGQFSEVWYMYICWVKQAIFL